MGILEHLLKNNRAWAEGIKAEDPEFFLKLSRQQSPDYLWIGCSDSRVPANQIVGLLPGELFVHRNVSNVVVHTDLNCLSVIQYAVEVLKVKHIIVCGHYGCGGVRAALNSDRHGLIDNWLQSIKSVIQKHEDILLRIQDETLRCDRLCELNVIEQVVNVSQTTVVRGAWDQGQELAVHGWIYGLHDGILRDLNVCIIRPDDITSVYRSALSRLPELSPDD